MANAYVIAMAGTPAGAGLALTDLQQWKATLAAALPAGDGEITRVGNMFRIRIRWTDSLGTQTFDTRARI
jgi:hypothetical protein